MKKKSDQLDHIVRDKLSQLRVEYNPQHWAQLEQKLDAEEAGMPILTDRMLDEVVFDKLHNVKVGDRAAHWDKLSTRLDIQIDVRRRLVVYKLMEACLILLLLLIIIQQFPLHSLPSHTAQQPIVLEEATATPQSNTNANVDENTASNAQVNTPESATASTATVEARSSNNPAITDTNLNSSAEAAATSDLVQDSPSAVEGSFKAKVSPTLPQSALSVPRFNKEAITLKNDIEPSDFQAVIPQRLELLNAIEQIMLSELQYTGQPGYVALISPIKRHSAWVVSMFGSGDYNQVITPRSIDEDRIYDRWLRYAPGYSGGITAGLDLGRWEIGGGAIYTAKKYERRPIVYLGGSFFDPYYEGEGLKYIELNMVQLPLYFRYNFIYHDKWRAYATMGLALQVNFQTNYYFADANAFDTNLPRSLTRPDQLLVPEEPLPGGWLDGGSLWQNGYISGNIGVGLERYVTGRWSIFTQPTYHHSLNYFTQGIGPDKDRINTMSIFAGVRVRLND
ncbi:MAG: hypothetical protein ACK4TA_19170 [Saprospiraceae bacterium]